MARAGWVTSRRPPVSLAARPPPSSASGTLRSVPLPLGLFLYPSVSRFFQCDLCARLSSLHALSLAWGELTTWKGPPDATRSGVRGHGPAERSTRGRGEPGRPWAAQWGAEPEEGAGQPALPQPMLRGQAGGHLFEETMKEPSASWWSRLPSPERGCLGSQAGKAD